MITGPFRTRGLARENHTAGGQRETVPPGANPADATHCAMQTSAASHVRSTKRGSSRSWSTGQRMKGSSCWNALTCWRPTARKNTGKRKLRDKFPEISGTKVVFRYQKSVTSERQKNNFPDAPLQTAIPVAIQ